jgi:hypothetical protein
LKTKKREIKHIKFYTARPPAINPSCKRIPGFGLLKSRRMVEEV